MQNTSALVPRRPSFLRVEVTPNDANDTFDTSVHCSKDGCSMIVDLDSAGPKTIQSVSCPKHGFLATFQHLNALGDFVRFSANEILTAMGHELIGTEAFSIFGNAQPPARSIVSVVLAPFSAAQICSMMAALWASKTRIKYCASSRDLYVSSPSRFTPAPCVLVSDGFASLLDT
jgi:hypothetical protein